MAAPVTHIVLADKFLKGKFNTHNRKLFIVGTSFPDIRYISSHNRDFTHFTGSKVNDLKDVDSFTAGVHFHSLLDLARENYIDNHSLDYRNNYGINFYQNIKLVEDVALYNLVSDWQTIIDYFDKPLDEEINMGFPYEIICSWHKVIQRYLKYTPTNDSVTNFLSSMGFPKIIINGALDEIEVLKHDKRINTYISDLYENVESLLL